jgi:hypothetical protein
MNICPPQLSIFRRLCIPDALSRATNSTQDCKDGDTATDDIFHLHIILPAKQEKLKPNATEKDPELQALKTTIEKGWPSNRLDERTIRDSPLLELSR